MKEINNYIIEKLHIGKNIKYYNPNEELVEYMMDLISPKEDKKDIEEIVSNWVGDYMGDRIFFYCTSIDYKYDYKSKMRTGFIRLFGTSISDDIMHKCVEKIKKQNKQPYYESTSNNIEYVIYTDLQLAVGFSNYQSPIIFEKKRM